MKSSKHAFLFIVITAFLGVMGIGFIIPVVPFIVANYVGAQDPGLVAFNVGLLISIYSLCQFFASPILGALSDRFGRRPVLLFCQLGSALGYFIFGIGGALWVLFLGRIIDGLTGGDISTIFAYVADITKPEERGKKFGIIGATVGVGFILGPTLGGLASTINLSAPFYIAGGITILNMLFGYFVLPESLDIKHRSNDFSLKHLNPFSQLESVLGKPALRTLLIIGFFYFLPFAQLQGISGVFLKDVMHFNPTNLGFLFLLIGVFDIFTQGFLSGKLIPKLGEKKMVIVGLFLTAIAYLFNVLLPSFPYLFLVIIGTIIYAIGSGFFEPAFGALISHTASPAEQGKVQGANQSMQALTRIIGPLLAAFLYGYGPRFPYLSCVILSLLGVAFIFNLLKNSSK